MAQGSLVTPPTEASQPPRPLPVPPIDDQFVEASPIGPPTTGAPALGWESLSRIHPKKFDKPPQFLRLPDGSEMSIGRWVNLPFEVVKWLADKGILTSERCPIRSASRYLVNVVPEHPGGKPFIHGKRVGGFHIEANYNGPDQHRNTVTILEHLAQDPNQFAVRF